MHRKEHFTAAFLLVWCWYSGSKIYVSNENIKTEAESSGQRIRVSILLILKLCGCKETYSFIHVN